MRVHIKSVAYLVSVLMLASMSLSTFSVKVSALSAGQDWIQKFNVGTGGNGSRMTTDASGDSYVITDTQNPTTGANSVYTIKYSPTGSQIWVGAYSNSSQPTASASPSGVTVDGAGNVYAAIQGSNSLIVIKYDVNGNELWRESQQGSFINNSSNSPRTIQVDSLGNVYAVDSSYQSGMLTVKYDSAGVLQWAQRYGLSYDSVVGLDLDSSGNVFIVGTTGSHASERTSTVVKYDPDGNQIWATPYAVSGYNVTADDITLDSQDNVYIVGNTDNTTSSAQNYLTIKYNSNGTQQWVQSYSTGGSSGANAVKVDASGYVYITGTSSNSGWTAYTIKYDTNGVQQWVRSYAYNGQDQAVSLQLDTSGNVYIGGPGYSNANSYAYVIVKYDNSGNRIWVASYDTPQIEILRDLALDPSNNIFVTGYTCDSSNTCSPTTIKYKQTVAPPVGLTIQSPTKTPVLAWNVDTDATSYNIYRNGIGIGSTTNDTYADSAASEGSYTYAVSAVSSGIESALSSSVAVLVDQTVPTISTSASPAANSAGWNNTNVVVSFSCNDALSGIAACTSPVTVSSESVTNIVTGTATDRAGNTTSTTTTIKLDKTSPTVSSPTMSNTLILLSGSATISSSTTDNLSGVVKGEYYIDTDPGEGSGQTMSISNGKIFASVLIQGLTLGQHKIYMRSQDAAGNWSSTTSVTFFYI